jgi:hypothetical protein
MPQKARIRDLDRDLRRRKFFLSLSCAPRRRVAENLSTVLEIPEVGTFAKGVHRIGIFFFIEIEMQLTNKICYFLLVTDKEKDRRIFRIFR